MPEFQLPDRLRTFLRWLFSSAAAVLATYALVKLKADSGTAGILYLVLVVWAATLARIDGKEEPVDLEPATDTKGRRAGRGYALHIQ